MNKGFSLVELIVVIAIMAILVGVAVPVYTSYIDKANDATDIQAIDNLEHACKIVAMEYDVKVSFAKNGNTLTATVEKKSDSQAATVVTAAADQIAEIVGTTASESKVSITLKGEPILYTANNTNKDPMVPNGINGGTTQAAAPSGQNQTP